jgi:hypothetical protein
MATSTLSGSPRPDSDIRLANRNHSAAEILRWCLCQHVSLSPFNHELQSLRLDTLQRVHQVERLRTKVDHCAAISRGVLFSIVHPCVRTAGSEVIRSMVMVVITIVTVIVIVAMSICW